jgi:hypothetical protein
MSPILNWPEAAASMELIVTARAHLATGASRPLAGPLRSAAYGLLPDRTLLVGRLLVGLRLCELLLLPIQQPGRLTLFLAIRTT